MNKILNWIYNNVKWINEYLRQLSNTHDKGLYGAVWVEAKTEGFVVEVKKLIVVIITIIIFLIMYKYDIQLISNEHIKYIKVYLKISFYLYIGNIIYYMIKGIYISSNADILIIAKGVNFTAKLINFIINACIICWLLNLNIELFLQYNIIFLIDITMLWVFYFYKNILDYEIEGDGIVSFLNYPWIMMIIIITLLKNGYEPYVFRPWSFICIEWAVLFYDIVEVDENANENNKVIDK